MTGLRRLSFGGVRPLRYHGERDGDVVEKREVVRGHCVRSAAVAAHKSDVLRAGKHRHEPVHAVVHGAVDLEGLEDRHGRWGIRPRAGADRWAGVGRRSLAQELLERPTERRAARGGRRKAGPATR